VLTSGPGPPLPLVVVHMEPFSTYPAATPGGLERPCGGKGRKAGSSPSRGALKEWGQSEPTVIVCLHCDRASNQIAFAAGVRAAHGRARRAGVRNTGCGRGACGRPRGARPWGARAAAEGCGRLQGAQAAAGRVGGVRGGARGRRPLSARAAVGRAGGCGACRRQ
jgi:hypothetical protein